MTKLWELSKDLREFESLIDDIIESDLSDSEKQVRLDHLFSEWLILNEQFEKKCEATACYIRRLESLTEARKQEAKRLRELAETSERQADKLREYLLINMLKHDKTKVEGTSVKLSLRKKPPKVSLNVPIEDIPTQYQRVKIEPKLDEIKKALKADNSIDWAQLSDDDDYSLTIR